MKLAVLTEYIWPKRHEKLHFLKLLKLRNCILLHFFGVNFVFNIEMLIIKSDVDYVVQTIVTKTVILFDHCGVRSRKYMNLSLPIVSNIDTVVLICADAAREEFLSHLFLPHLPSGFTSDYLHRHDTMAVRNT